jgi:hypothetical protein
MSEQCQKMASCSSTSGLVDKAACPESTNVTDPNISVENPSTSAAMITDENPSKYPAILDGTFFRIVSVGDDGDAVKAVCITCPASKKPFSGAITSTTNFLNHLKVGLIIHYLSITYQSQT